jgi:hypothetical protein
MHMKLTDAQAQVLRDVVGTPGNLEEAFDHFRCSHRYMPFMVDDRAFTKVLEALQRRGLIALVGGYYHPSDAGRDFIEAANEVVVDNAIAARVKERLDGR